MEKRNTNSNSNRSNRQYQANRELELERKLMRESTRLDDADVWNLPYEKSLEIYLKQDEMYHKWKLLKVIREAREKINEKPNQKNIRK